MTWYISDFQIFWAFAIIIYTVFMHGIKINIYFSIFQIDTTNTFIACELSVHSNTKRNVIYVFIFTPDILDRILDSK